MSRRTLISIFCHRNMQITVSFFRIWYIIQYEVVICPHYRLLNELDDLRLKGACLWNNPVQLNFLLSEIWNLQLRQQYKWNLIMISPLLFMNRKTMVTFNCGHKQVWSMILPLFEKMLCMWANGFIAICCITMAIFFLVIWLLPCNIYNEILPCVFPLLRDRQYWS